MAKKKNDVQVQVGANIDDFLAEIRRMLQELKKLDGKGSSGLGDDIAKKVKSSVKELKKLDKELSGLSSPDVSFSKLDKNLTKAIDKARQLQAELAKTQAIPVASVEATVDAPRGQTKKRTVKPSKVREPSPEMNLFEESLNTPAGAGESEKYKPTPAELKRDKVLQAESTARMALAKKEQQQAEFIADTKAKLAKKNYDQEQKIADMTADIWSKVAKKKCDQEQADLKKREAAEAKAIEGLAKLREKFDANQKAGAKMLTPQQYAQKQIAEASYNRILDQTGSDAKRSTLFSQDLDEYKKVFANRQAEKQAINEVYDQLMANKEAERKANKKNADELAKVNKQANEETFRQLMANRNAEEKAIKGLAKLRKDYEDDKATGKTLTPQAYAKKQGAEQTYNKVLDAMGSESPRSNLFTQDLAKYTKNFNNRQAEQKALAELAKLKADVELAQKTSRPQTPTAYGKGQIRESAANKVLDEVGSQAPRSNLYSKDLEEYSKWYDGLSEKKKADRKEESKANSDTRKDLREEKKLLQQLKDLRNAQTNREKTGSSLSPTKYADNQTKETGIRERLAELGSEADTGSTIFKQSVEDYVKAYDRMKKNKEAEKQAQKEINDQVKANLKEDEKSAQIREKALQYEQSTRKAIADAQQRADADREKALQSEQKTRSQINKEQEKAVQGLAKLQRDKEIAQEVQKPLTHTAYLRKQDAENTYNSKLSSMGAGDKTRQNFQKSYQDYLKDFNKAIEIKVDTKQAETGLRGLRQRLLALKDRIITVKVQNQMNRVGGQAKAVGASLPSLPVAGAMAFRKALVESNVVITAISMSLDRIATGFAAILQPGFDFVRQTETAQTGIAGIISSMGQLDGKAISFNDAMDMSKDIFKKLQADAMRTAATTQELVTTFQGLVAPGMGAGLKMDEIQQFTTTGVNMAKAMGLDQTQFVQELRDLLQGGIQAGSSTIATALGLTDADIKAAKESSEGLFKFLMDRMSGANAMAEHFPKTINGMLSQIQEFSQVASASIVQEFDGEIRHVLEYVRDLFGSFDKDTGEFTLNPKIKELTASLKDFYQWVLECIDYWRDLYGAFVDSEEGMITLRDYFKALWERCKLLVSAIGSALTVIVEFWNVIYKSDTAQAILGFMVDCIEVVNRLIEAYTILNKETATYMRTQAGRQSSSVANDAIRRKLKEEEAKAMADWEKQRQELLGNTPVAKPNVNDVTSKYPREGKGNDKAAKDALKAQKDALNKQTELIKRNLEKILELIKDSLEEVEVAYQQNQVSLNDYLKAKAQASVDENKAKLDAVNKQIEATKSSGAYENEAERQSALTKLNWEKEDITRALNKSTRAQADVAKQIESFSQVVVETTKAQVAVLQKSVAQVANVPQGQPQKVGGLYSTSTRLEGEGDTWERSGRGVNVESQNDNAKFLLNNMAAWFKEQTGRPLTVTSAYRGTGEHHGQSFDVADDAFWDKEFRKKFQDYVQNVLKAGAADEYDYPVPYATGAHMHVNATGKNHTDLTHGLGKGYYGGVDPDALVKANSNVGLQSSVQALQEITNEIATTMEGLEAKKEQKELLQEVRNAIVSYNELYGDTSDIQLDELVEDYKNRIEKLYINGFEDVAKALEVVLDVKMSELLVDEQSTNLDTAMSVVNDNLQTTGLKIQGLLVSWSDTLEKYSNRFEGGNSPGGVYDFATILDNLYVQLQEFTAVGATKQIVAVKAKIKELYDHIGNSVESLLSSLEELFDWESNMVNARDDLTSSQKERAQGVITSRRHYARAHTYETMARDLREEKNKRLQAGEITQVDADGLEATARSYDRIVALNKELARIPTLLEKTRSTAKQALEDGLNKFLTDGVNNAESLGEAFRDMVTSILQELQKLFAKAITDDIMDGLFGKSIDKRSDEISTEMNQNIEGGQINTEVSPDNTTNQNIDAHLQGAVTVLGTMDATLLRIEQLMQGSGVTDPNATVAPTPMSTEGTLPSDVTATAMETATELQTATATVDAEIQSTGFTLSGTVQGLSTQLTMTAQELATSIQTAIMQLVTTMQSASAAVSASGGGGGSGGGEVAGFATGGYIQGPGTGTSDSIPAMLSNGEFVIRAQAVKKFGVSALKRINEGRWGAINMRIPKFAGGGLVGDAGADVADKFGFVNAQPVINNTTTVKNYVDGKAVFDTYGREMVRSEVKKQTIANAKLSSMLSRRV